MRCKPRRVAIVESGRGRRLIIWQAHRLAAGKSCGYYKNNDDDDGPDAGDEGESEGDIPSSEGGPIPKRMGESTALAIFEVRDCRQSSSYMMSLSSRLETMLKPKPKTTAYQRPVSSSCKNSVNF